MKKPSGTDAAAAEESARPRMPRGDWADVPFAPRFMSGGHNDNRAIFGVLVGCSFLLVWIPVVFAHGVTRECRAAFFYRHVIGGDTVRGGVPVLGGKPLSFHAAVGSGHGWKSALFSFFDIGTGVLGMALSAVAGYGVAYFLSFLLVRLRVLPDNGKAPPGESGAMDDVS